MLKKGRLWFGLLSLSGFMLVFCLSTTALPAQGLEGMSDEELLAWMGSVNEQLLAAGLNVAIEEIEFFTIGAGRPAVRIHQQSFRWVAGDARRLAAGDALTFMVDPTWPGTIAPTEPATATEVRAAMGTWASEACLKKVPIFENPYPGGDVTFFDAFFCGGSLGFPFAADIVNAGWYPQVCFGANTLAFSVSFIFVNGATGVPTDINGDNYLDTALNEVYYNDRFNWGTGAPAIPTIDVQTVALHELGHSLGIGHFGPPPAAVMNPVYAGPRQSPLPIDHAGMCAVFGSWPK